VLYRQAHTILVLEATEVVNRLLKCGAVLASKVGVSLGHKLFPLERANLEVKARPAVDKQFITEDVRISLRLLIKTHFLCEDEIVLLMPIDCLNSPDRFLFYEEILWAFHIFIDLTLRNSGDPLGKVGIGRADVENEILEKLEVLEDASTHLCN
jgi:hypothetical protein